MDNQSLLDEMVSEDSIEMLKAVFYLCLCKISGVKKYTPALPACSRERGDLRPVQRQSKSSGNALSLQQCLPRQD